MIDKDLIKRLLLFKNIPIFTADSYVKLHPRASQRRVAFPSGGLPEDVPVRELS